MFLMTTLTHQCIEKPKTIMVYLETMLPKRFIAVSAVEDTQKITVRIGLHVLEIKSFNNSRELEQDSTTIHTMRSRYMEVMVLMEEVEEQAASHTHRGSREMQELEELVGQEKTYEI
jgi:hypothetical protein